MKHRRSQKSLWLITLLIFLPPPAAHSAGAPAPLQGLDAYVTQAMHDAEVPGLAIAVVKDDAIVFAKGYGVRKLGEPAPVDEHTLFAIASTTKAFTAAALGMLVDEGKLRWDDPVTKFLPAFQLYDPYVTREVTVRDLLAHRSGLGGADDLWLGSGYGRDELLRRMRFLKPETSFRSKFGYQNIMYLVVGQIIPAITGKSWEEFVHERILRPLGMTASSTSITALHQVDNVATPHELIDDKVQPLPWLNVDNMGPAAAINSNVMDMAQWIRLLLREGNYEGKQLLSARRVKEMESPNIVADLPSQSDPIDNLPYPADHFLTYGLAWAIMDYHGRKVVHHNGGIRGMRAKVALVPEEKLGVVILSNLGARPLPWVLYLKILDAYLGVPARDWAGEYLRAIKAEEAQSRSKRARAEAERDKDARPRLPLDRYAGRYQNNLYGDAVVSFEGGQLRLRSAGLGWDGTLAHWQYDTFEATWPDRTRDRKLVTFPLSPEGKVDEMQVQGLADFHRVP
jgi:CubicO group peptidase (beta-lactamase class C family)